MSELQTGLGGSQGLPELPTTVKPFPLKSLSTQLDEKLSQIPTGAKGVLLGYANGEEAGAVVAIRLGRGWDLIAEVERDWDGDFEGELMVRKTW